MAGFVKSDDLSWLRFEVIKEAIEHGDGRGVQVAILDSGVELSHPVLEHLSLSEDVHFESDGLTVTSSPGDGTDVYGHGTAVASIIHGLAPAASLASYRVLSQDLRSRSAIIQVGVSLAIEQGCKILNCSFGCGLASQLPHYKAWVDEAYVRGVHIVAAAASGTREQWPSHFPSVISVAMGRTSPTGAINGRRGHLVEFMAEEIDCELPWAVAFVWPLNPTMHSSG